MRSLASFRGIHAGQKIVVCGCGSSLNDLRAPERFITIGVNDVGRLFQPRYLVVVDGRERFKDDRFQFVETSQAEYLFTQLHNLDVPHPNIVKFPLGEKNGTSFANPKVLNFSVITPYLALCLAAHMGARCIGLIGVDFTQHHFFRNTGVHEWTPYVAAIDEHFYRLGNAILKRGSRVFNLSRASLLTAFPKMDVEEFAALQVSSSPARRRRPLKLISYAASPEDRTAAALARAINLHTPHYARCTAPGGDTGNPPTAVPDLDPDRAPATTVAELESADAILLQPGGVDPRHRLLITSKPVVATSSARANMSELNGAGAPSDRGRARGFALQWEAFWQPTISQAVRKLKRAKPQPLVRAARYSVPAVPFRVTVVVVNLNEGEFLKRTVDSLLATLPAGGEIIVVDDGSTDGSQTFLTGGYNGVTLLRHTERLGVAGARNFGARHARGDVLVFADAHVAVSLGWEGPLLRVLENSAVGAVSPAIRVMRFPEDYSPDTWASSKEARGYGLTWQDASLGVKWLGRKSLEPYAIPLQGGAFLAMRHELFVASGGFDDGMILWGTEDSEISYRLWSLGYECLVVPSVEVAHHFRSKRPYDIDWVPVLHNRLRLAAIHFNEGRRLRVLDQLRRNACLDAALTRLNRGDTAHIRGRLGTVRCHDDDWFFQRFSDVSPPEFKAGPRQTNGPGTS